MKRWIVFALVFVMGMSFIFAGFSVGDPAESLETNYAPSDYLRGWINMSFNQEPSDSLFADNLGNSVTLLKIINENSQVNVNCSNEGCNSDFEGSAPEGQKSFSLEQGQNKVLGFKVTGDVDKINSVKFTINSNAPVSCSQQYKIDFLADEVYETGNTKKSNQVCEESRSYGCFDSEETTETYQITSNLYCQKIEVKESPSVRVGAWVEKTEGGSALTMHLFNGSRELGTCPLIPPQTQGEVYCDINYLTLEDTEYSVCISAQENNKYRTHGYEDSSCDTGTAYHIFAEEKKFNTPGTITFNDGFSSGNFSELADDYIDENFNMECGSDGCIVPIKIFSEATQTITVNGLEVSYEKGGKDVITEQIYDLAETPSKVSSGFEKFYLDNAGFKIEDDEGDINYVLRFEGEEIYDDEITIGGIPLVVDLNPKTAALGFETEFTVYVEKADANISKYEWDFDGTKTTKTNNKAKHTFNTLGKNNVSVKITDTNNLSHEKKFTVDVQTSIAQINLTINNLEKKIKNLEGKITDYPVFYQSVLENVLDINGSKKSLEDIKSNYENALGEEEYLKIVANLSQIDLPDTISTTKQINSFTFPTQEKNIDLDRVESVSTETYETSDEGKYSDAIFLWAQDNIDAKINFKEISSIEGGRSEFLVNFFEVNIDEKNAVDYDYYLFIHKMDDLFFKENYGEGSGSVYAILAGPGTNYVFSTTEEIEFIDLPAFVSPGIENLNVQTSEPLNEKLGVSKWVFFTLIVVFLLIVAFVVYLILHQWYKNKYEAHLFRNRNNLINILNFINIQKKKGVSDDEIRSKLKKARWNSEQINYAMKKFKGKKTGMIDLPLINLFYKSKKEVKNPPRGVPPRTGPFRRRL